MNYIADGTNVRCNDGDARLYVVLRHLGGGRYSLFPADGQKNETQVGRTAFHDQLAIAGDDNCPTMNETMVGDVSVRTFFRDANELATLRRDTVAVTVHGVNVTIRVTKGEADDGSMDIVNVDVETEPDCPAWTLFMRFNEGAEIAYDV